MKASELMLYDWVQHDTMGVTRVVQLDYFSSIKKPREGIGLTIRYTEEYVGVVNTLERLVHGIPLTAEILVKNGFLRHKSISWGEVYTGQVHHQFHNQEYIYAAPEQVIHLLLLLGLFCRHRHEKL